MRTARRIPPERIDELRRKINDKDYIDTAIQRLAHVLTHNMLRS